MPITVIHKISFRPCLENPIRLTTLEIRLVTRMQSPQMKATPQSPPLPPPTTAQQITGADNGMNKLYHAATIKSELPDLETLCPVCALMRPNYKCRGKAFLD